MPQGKGTYKKPGRPKKNDAMKYERTTGNPKDGIGKRAAAQNKKNMKKSKK